MIPLKLKRWFYENIINVVPAEPDVSWAEFTMATTPKWEQIAGPSLDLKLYVEISPRQVGKTTRLFERMNEWLNSDEKNVAFLQCLKMDYFHQVISKLEPEKRQRVLYVQDGNSYDKLQRGIEHHRIAFFCDEFDLLSKGRFFFVPDGYYCTTPGYYRDKTRYVEWKIGNVDDPLLSLVKAANDEGIGVTQFFSFENFFNEEMQRHLHPTQREREWGSTTFLKRPDLE